MLKILPFKTVLESHKTDPLFTNNSLIHKGDNLNTRLPFTLFSAFILQASLRVAKVTKIYILSILLS